MSPGSCYAPGVDPHIHTEVALDAWLDAFERKVPWLAIPGLIRGIAMLMLVTWFLDASGTFPIEAWLFDANAIWAGQFWRTATFLAVPMSGNPFYLLLELMFLVMTADGLEGAWGTWRLTVYYLIGALGTIAVGFLLPGMPIGSYFLNLSLFFGFATIYPEFEILVFFVIPVKMKWLALLSAASVVWVIVFWPLVFKIAAMVAFLNYLLFFGPAALNAMRRGASSYSRRRDFVAHLGVPDGKARHTCSTCNRTELTNPELEFRYCSCPACGEGKPFCAEHLARHKEAPKA